MVYSSTAVRSASSTLTAVATTTHDQILTANGVRAGFDRPRAGDNAIRVRTGSGRCGIEGCFTEHRRRAHEGLPERFG